MEQVLLCYILIDMDYLTWFDYFNNKVKWNIKRSYYYIGILVGDSRADNAEEILNRR